MKKNYHFVKDYEKLVADLKKTKPLDEAMSIAIGGGWGDYDSLFQKILKENYLKNDFKVLDFGCGSGRVASALSKKYKFSKYDGIDIVQDLLDYAKKKCPKYFNFILNQDLKLPTENDYYDYAFAFSVFTHLHQSEILIYLREIHRSLRNKGLFLFSYLDLKIASNYEIFEATAAAYKDNSLVHLNMFLSKDQIRLLAKKTGFKVIKFDETSMGQPMVLLKKDCSGSFFQKAYSLIRRIKNIFNTNS